MKRIVCCGLLVAMAALGCGRIEAEEAGGLGAVSQATVTPIVKYGIELGGILPWWVPSPKAVCEALEGTAFTATVDGCTTTYTITDCNYDSSTKVCSCTGTYTRSGSCG